MPGRRARGARAGARGVVLGTSALLVVGGAVSGQARRCLSEQARLDLPVVSEARIHPGGDAVLYTVIDLRGPSSTIHRWDEADDRRREIGTGRAPAWSPGGERAAFLSAAEGGLQIRMTDDAGTRRVSDHPGGVSEFAWSPDGRRIAFAATPVAAEETDEASGESATGLQLHVLDVESGATRRLTNVTGSVYVAPFGGGGSFAWSPDGSRIAFASQPDRSVEAAYRSDLWVVEVESGRRTPLVERPGLDIRPAWSPDGSRIAFTTSFGRLDRFTAHGLAFVDVASGEIADLGAEVDAAFLDAPAGHAWTDDGGVLVLAARGLQSVVLRVDATTGEIATVLDPLAGETAATIAGVTFSADRRRAAYVSTSPARPWEARMVEVGRGLESSGEVARPALVAGEPLDWEVIRWRSPGGMQLEGLYFHPCARESRAREGRARESRARESRAREGGASETDARAPGPPVVTWLHGGPEGRAILGFDPTSPLAGPSFDPLPTRGLLARGYAVFMPNFRLSAGYEAEVRTMATGRVPEALAEDVLSGLDAIVERGLADAERIALAGWASGGLYAAQLLTRTDRFRAAVIGAANTSLQAAYGDGDFPIQWHSLQGGPPWAERAAWDAASPLRNAGRISTPVLLLHGDADDLVPLDQSRYLHTYLRGQGKTVELETLSGVGHGVVLPAQRLPVAERIYDWLDRWLG